MALICSYVIPKPRRPNHAGFASNFGFSRVLALALALGPSILTQVMGFHHDPLVGGTGGKLRRPACSEGCLPRYQSVTSHFSLTPEKEHPRHATYDVSRLVSPPKNQRTCNPPP